MTRQPAFQHVPHEILQKIFSPLAKKTLRQCQFVCRSWYLTAHLLIMNEIFLGRSAAIKQFLRSIQTNQHPLYLNAVRTLTIDNSSSKGRAVELTKEDIMQLVCQFPYLKQIHIGLLRFPLESINDEELCEAISKNCPELEYISIGEGLLQSQRNVKCYYDIAYKLRHQWTKITVRISRKTGKQVMNEEQTLQFLSSLPRLKEVDVQSYFGPRAMESYLTMIKHLPPLEKFKCKTESDRENFVERYLWANDNEGKELLLNRLASIKSFTVYNDCTGRLCVHLIDFITQYLTGLEALDYTCTQIWNFDAESKNAFCNVLLDFASRLPSYSITIPSTKNAASILNFIEAASQRAHDPLPNHIKYVERHIKIHLSASDSFFAMTMQSRKIDDQRISRSMELWSPNPRLYNGLFEKIVEAMAFTHDIYDLELLVSKTAYVDNKFPLRFFPAFETLLNGLPSLTKLMLTTPSLHHNTNYTPTAARYPNVKHLEMNIQFNTGRTKVIGDIISMFPGVKYLILHYYCGSFIRRHVRYDLLLDEMELKELHFDITSVYDRIKQINTEQYDRLLDSFFIINIHLLGEQRYRFFKVFQEGYFQMKEIDEQDLAKAAAGKEYFQICITVKDLKLLKIYYVNPRFFINSSFDAYFQDDFHDIMEAQICLI